MNPATDSHLPPRPPGWRLDGIAGLTAAAVVLPKAMGYATVAGLPVAVGLHTTFVPMLIYALLGSSHVLGVSSTATLAAIVIVYSVGLVDPAGFRAIHSVRSMKFRWAVAAAFGVLVFGTLQGIVAAIVL